MKHKSNVYVIRKATRQESLCLNGVAVNRPIGHLAFVLEHYAGHEHMVLQILANAGQVLDDIDSKTAKRRRFPTPDSIRSFGLWMDPAARITSLSAAISVAVPPVIT